MHLYLLSGHLLLYDLHLVALAQQSSHDTWRSFPGMRWLPVDLLGGPPLRAPTSPHAVDGSARRTSSLVKVLGD